MRDFAKIEAELRFAADNGCDHTLLIEAADALAVEDKMIQKLSSIVVRNAQIRITVDELKETADQIEQIGTEKQKTVYVKMSVWTTQEEIEAIERSLNARSPDKIVVLPTYVDIMNP